MAKVAYKGVSCSGHATYPGTTAVEGSNDVFINGKPAFRQGDSAGTHCNTQPPYDCHERTASKGSSTVFINSKPLMRDGDAISCGGSVSGGSNNVFSS